MPLRLLRQHLIHGRIHLAPVSLLSGQLRLAGTRQRIKPGSAPILQFGPLSFDPPLLGQALQSWKQRARPYDERAARDLLDAVRDPDAMQRPKFQRAENEEIQCPWQELDRFHVVIISASDIDCRYTRQR